MQNSIFTLQKWEVNEEAKYITIDQRDNRISTLNFYLTLKKIIIPAKMQSKLYDQLFDLRVNKPFLLLGLDTVGENLTFLAE